MFGQRLSSDPSPRGRAAPQPPERPARVAGRSLRLPGATSCVAGGRGTPLTGSQRMNGARRPWLGEHPRARTKKNLQEGGGRVCGEAYARRGSDALRNASGRASGPQNAARRKHGRSTGQGGTKGAQEMLRWQKRELGRVPQPDRDAPGRPPCPPRGSLTKKPRPEPERSAPAARTGAASHIGSFLGPAGPRRPPWPARGGAGRGACEHGRRAPRRGPDHGCRPGPPPAWAACRPA